MHPPIIVVSTAGPHCPAWAQRKCVGSVATQVGVDMDHIYRECSVDEYFPTMASLIAKLPAAALVVNLDGDDWLGPTDALEIVARTHAAGALVTYGSFIYADGRPGFAAPYAAGEDVRATPWRATHLKTFRAGLFQSIDQRDFQDADGRWLAGARDQAFMLPLLEMAGHDRAVYIPDVLCVYNAATSGEFQDPARTVVERAAAAVVRGKTPYARVELSCPY